MRCFSFNSLCSAGPLFDAKKWRKSARGHPWHPDIFRRWLSFASEGETALWLLRYGVLDTSWHRARSPRGIAAVAYATNMPLACLLNAAGPTNAETNRTVGMCR